MKLGHQPLWWLSITPERPQSACAFSIASHRRRHCCGHGWYGTDPNWGRVICAAGYSGARVEEAKARISYGGIAAFDRGTVIADADTLAAMKKAMSERAFTVDVDLGLGSGACTIYTSDLTHQYVTINADYTT